MNIDEFLKTIKDLPTIPMVADEINLNEKKKSLTAKGLSDIISRDPALTAKVLKLANSAYYGLAREVGTLDRAVTILGFDTIKSLALTISVFQVFRGPGGKVPDLAGLWYHSLAVALAARHLAGSTPEGKANRSLVERAFVGGVLHDIGKIAIARNLPEEMAGILARAGREKRPQSAIEKEVLGFAHQEIGAALADSWNFPEEYLAVIRLHHGPVAAIESVGGQGERILVLSVCLANKIAKALRLGESTDPAVEKVVPADLRTLGIGGVFAEIIHRIQDDFQTMREQWSYEG